MRAYHSSSSWKPLRRSPEDARIHHRYQLQAAVKTVGGMEYNYAHRGDGQWPTRIVSGERQRRALAVVLGILAPVELDIPEPVLALLTPRPFEYPRHRELFASSTQPAFDALGAARTAADQVLQALLQAQRLGRPAAGGADRLAAGARGLQLDGLKSEA